MIEVKPAGLRLSGQLGEAFVDRLPLAKDFQPLGLSFAKRLLHAVHAEVVYIVIKVDVDSDERVGQEHPAQLGEYEPVVGANHHFGCE